MAKKIAALVKPELLIWAREDAGFTHDYVADKLKVSRDKILKWENGTEQLSLTQLRKLSTLYKRPLAVFFLSKPPRDFMPMKDFRNLPNTYSSESLLLKTEVRQILYKRDVAIKLYKDLQYPLNSFHLTVTVNDDPEAIAQKIRNGLAITSEEQAKFKDQYAILNYWRRKIEEKGFLVFQIRGVELSEMRAFSINDSALPIIGINNKDTPRARAFSIIHELTHILLNNTGICDLSDNNRYDKSKEKLEVFCNHVAGAVLVPREDLLKNTVVSQNRSLVWSEDSLDELSKFFGASKETVLRRLLTFKLTTKEFYEKKREELLLSYKLSKEDKKNKKAIVTPDVKAISTNGVGFTKILLDGFYKEKISLRDLSDVLEVKVKQIGKIEKKILLGTPA